MSVGRVAGLSVRFDAPRKRRPWPRAAMIAQRSAWALIGMLFAGSHGAAISARAEATPGEKIPVETIRFAPGASGAVVSGAVIRGERAFYALDARSGQWMSLSLSSAENNAAFQVYRPGARAERRNYGVRVLGAALPGAGEGADARRWSGVLPETGAYLVAVGPTRGNATYRLSVAIR